MRPSVLSAAALVASCALYQSKSDDPERPNDGEGQRAFRVVADLLPEATTEVDLLFVVDDSGGMIEHQDALGTGGIPELLRGLRAAAGQPLNLHIGFVSTSIGVGPYSDEIMHCDQSPDAAMRPLESCSLGTGRYLRDGVDSDGQPVQNFEGELTDAIACMLLMGSSGCGFEQPLEAMRRALAPNNPHNIGFMRPGALLVVVILTDEDDCSASDPELFSPDPDSPLGPLSSFRCFVSGVVCESRPLDSREGEYAGCRSNDDSDYMTGMDEFRAFLTELKEPGEVIVALVAGHTEPVRVGDDGYFDDLFLLPSCAGIWEALPPIRLAGFTDSFGPRGHRLNLCDQPLRGLRRFGDSVARTARRDRCVQGALYDSDSAIDGVQPLCRARSIQRLVPGIEQETELGNCHDTGAGPCYAINPDPLLCDDTPSHLRLDVSDDVNGRVQLECAVP